jgi:large subunit ribosomal protein L4
MKSPVFIGGGRVFGPRPRNYSFKLNKKLKVVARLSALSAMAKDNKIALVENLEMSVAKTKDFVSILSNLKVSEKKTLMVTGAMNPNVVLSARNLPKVKVSVATSLSTYDILNAETVLFTEESINSLEQLYSNK